MVGPWALVVALSLVAGSSVEVGFGLSVFEGSRPDTFGVEVLGRLEGSVPGEDRLVVRLTGGMAERTGVAAGMSGSPVYLGGRLVGALSSTFTFAAEPIGIVTPIAAMLRPREARAPGPSGAALPLSGTALGFGDEALARLSSALEVGVSFVGGGKTASPGELEPGGVASVVLVDGDWLLALTGTVTYRSGDTVALLGHSLFGYGDVVLPLAGGSVVATVPSRALSFKVSSPGPTVGAVTFDGPSGALGELGRTAPTLPVRITATGSHTRGFDLRLAVHPLLTPLLLRTCVFNCGSMVGGGGAVTSSATFRVRFADGSSRSMERAATGPGAFARLADEFGAVLDALMGCPLGTILPDSLELVACVSERPSYYVESVEVTRLGGEPPEVMVEARFLSKDGVPTVRSARLALPKSRDVDALRLEAGDASTIAQWERERGGLAHVPATIPHYLDGVFADWAPTRFYLRVVRSDKGWVRRGSEVPRLPPSIAAVLGRAPQRGRHGLTGFSVVSSAEFALDGPVFGSAVVDLMRMKEGKDR